MTPSPCSDVLTYLGLPIDSFLTMRVWRREFPLFFKRYPVETVNAVSNRNVWLTGFVVCRVLLANDEPKCSHSSPIVHPRSWWIWWVVHLNFYSPKLIDIRVPRVCTWQVVYFPKPLFVSLILYRQRSVACRKYPFPHHDFTGLIIFADFGSVHFWNWGVLR